MVTQPTELANNVREPTTSPEEKGDRFTNNVLRRVPTDVFDSFIEEQWNTIRKALTQVHNGSRHLIDVRTTLSLYFCPLLHLLPHGAGSAQRDERGSAGATAKGQLHDEGGVSNDGADHVVLHSTGASRDLSLRRQIPLGNRRDAELAPVGLLQLTRF